MFCEYGFNFIYPISDSGIVRCVLVTEKASNPFVTILICGTLRYVHAYTHKTYK